MARFDRSAADIPQPADEVVTADATGEEVPAAELAEPQDPREEPRSGADDAWLPL